MTHRAPFTAAQLARAIKAARAVDPGAIVEIVTPGGVVRILPGESAAPLPVDPFDAWKETRGNSNARPA